MFNSLKDRLNSAVNSGISPKSEKSEVDDEEGGAKATSPRNSPTKVDSEPETTEEINKSLLQPPESGAASEQRSSVDSSRGEATEETSGEFSDDIKNKLEKLKKYEAKYPELAKAYKSQVAKLKSLDQVLQAWTPVQTYSDHDGLEEYLKNMVSQTAMTTSEFKAISQLKNELQTKTEELQKSLDSATTQIKELEAEKERKIEVNLSLRELLTQLRESITNIDLTKQDDSTKTSLAELATEVLQGLGQNEQEDTALALKELRSQLDTLSQEHRTALEEMESLKEKADKANSVKDKYNELCQLCPNSNEPVSSLKAHLHLLLEDKNELEKKVGIQNGIVTSLKQTLETKKEQVSTLTNEIENLKKASPQAAPQTNGASKTASGKKKKKNKSGSSPISPTKATADDQEKNDTLPEVDRSAHDKLESLVNQQKEEIEVITSKLALVTNELEETKANLSAVQKELDSQTSEYKRSSSELADVNSRHTALELAYSDIQKDLDAQKAKGSELTEKLKTSEDRAEEISKKLEEAAQLETQLASIKTQLQASQDETKQQQTTITRLTKRVSQLDGDLKAKDTALAYSKRQHAQLEQEKKEIVAEIASQQKQIKEITSLSKKKDVDAAAHQAELKTLRDESEISKAQLADAEAKSAQLELQIEQLKTSINSDKTEALSLSEANLRLKEQVDSAVQGKEEAHKKLESHMQAFTDLQQELNELKKRCEVLDQELITSRQLFKDKAASLDILHLQHVQLQESAAEEAAKLNNELQIYKDKQQQLQKELETQQASTRDEIKLLQVQLAEAQKKLDDHIILAKELKITKDECTTKLANLNMTFETLSASNEAYKLELSQAQERLERFDKVEEDIKKLSQERDALSEQSKLRESHLRNLNRDLKEEVKRLQRPGSSFLGSPPSSPTDSRAPSDFQDNDENQSFNVEYLRNIILKFLSDRDRRPQLVTVLGHLLKFSPTDTRKLMDTIHS